MIAWTGPGDENALGITLQNPLSAGGGRGNSVGMMMDVTSLAPEEAYAALRFQLDMGVDEALHDSPSDLSVAVKVAPKVVAPPSPAKLAALLREKEAAESADFGQFITKSAPSAPPVDLSKIMSLEDLKAAVASITGLPLKDTAMNLVFGEGILQPTVMVIGEAPGEEEDRSGRPFVGPAGQLLEKMLAAIGFKRDDIYISNVLPWRPPGNRTPKTDEVATCLPYLMRHVELVAPKFLLLMGGPAAKAMLSKDESVTKMRGQWWSYHSPGLAAPIPTLVTYHPAYLLRSPGQKKESWRDLRLLKKKIDTV